MRTTALYTTLLAAGISLPAAAQDPLPLIPITPTTITSVTPDGEKWVSDLASAPGGNLTYYTFDEALRAYDRSSGKTTIALKGNYDYVTVSQAGDLLVLLRPEEGGKPGPDLKRFVWTVTVNPKTGAATGTPKRVSLLSAMSPRISPDGKWIAFIARGEFRRMVVIPAAGGTERVLFERGGPDGPLRWSPDGKWLYFNQPAPGVAGKRVFSRVAVEGGTPTPVSPPMFFPSPGLSPDGRYLAGIIDMQGPEKLTLGVFNTEGRLLARFAPKGMPSGEPAGVIWSAEGNKLQAAIGTAPISLRIRSLADGSDRVVPLGGQWPRIPVMSPDGKRLAMAIGGETALWELVTMNSDGTDRRKITELTPNDLQQPEWSPDSRFVAYAKDRYKSLFVADVATGKETKVGGSTLNVGDFRWSPDSRTLRYISDSGSFTKTSKFLRQTSLDGVDRLLREFTSQLPAEGEQHYAATYLVGESTLLTIRLGIIFPAAGGEPLKLYEPTKVGQGAKAPSATLDGRWIARTLPDQKAFEIISSDGRIRNTVALPDGATLEHLPYPQAIAGSFLVGTAATTSKPPTLYLLPVDGGAPREVLRLQKGHVFNDLSVSRDGKHIIYADAGQLSFVFVELDLGKHLKQ